LLDEPESHFNPQWRIKFVQLLNEITSGKHQCILLTSHAPFIVSDCRAENVQIFRRTANELGVEVSAPKAETYGASFDSLLEDVFDVKPPVARKSLEDLRQLQREGTVEEIEQRIDEFADSAEKFYLFQRIERLKSES
jgi:ABC-type multidrug transport system ATPase subunit